MIERRRLAESLEMVLVVEPNLDIVTDNMVSEWGSTPYPQLSVLLAHLKFLCSRLWNDVNCSTTY